MWALGFREVFRWIRPILSFYSREGHSGNKGILSGASPHWALPVSLGGEASRFDDLLAGEAY